MKKMFLLLAVVFISALTTYATDSTSTTTTSSGIRPNFEKMGPPPQDGNFTNRPTPPYGNFKGGQRPSKKPDSKPLGDRVPPEFTQSSGVSTTTTGK